VPKEEALAPKKVVIYGAGQLAALVVEILGCRHNVELVGFADDDADLAGQEVAGLPVWGGMKALAELRGAGVSGAIVSIGDNRIRGQVAARLAELGFELVNAVDPTARIAASARLGKGNIIAAGAIVCTNALVGSNVYVGPGAIVSHDVSVGDNVLLSVGSILAGRTVVERGAFIGAGATVVPPRMGQRHRLCVGENAVVAAGCAVLADVPANAVVVGVPGRVVRFRQPDERQV
jgi:UDP-perosamine 4-acetyltransferase